MERNLKKYKLLCDSVTFSLLYIINDKVQRVKRDKIKLYNDDDKYDV